MDREEDRRQRTIQLPAQEPFSRVVVSHKEVGVLVWLPGVGVGEVVPQQTPLYQGQFGDNFFWLHS